VIGEAFHFIRRSVPTPDRAATLQTTGDAVGDNRYQITLQSDRLLQGVTVNAKGYLPDDNYFHLPPGRMKTVTFRATSAQAPSFKALVEAINMGSSHVVSARPKST
jgi:beta-mannosidase